MTEIGAEVSSFRTTNNLVWILLTMADTENAATENTLLSHYAKLGSDDDTYAKTESPDDKVVSDLRHKIEPWLCSLFQGEHLSLRVGNGLTRAACSVAGAESASMESDQFTTEWGQKIEAAAKDASQSAGRGDEPNIEDRVGAANKLLQGLCIECVLKPLLLCRESLFGPLRRNRYPRF